MTGQEKKLPLRHTMWFYDGVRAAKWLSTGEQFDSE